MRETEKERNNHENWRIMKKKYYHLIQDHLLKSATTGIKNAVILTQCSIFLKTNLHLTIRSIRYM